jgi:uncharacterized protein DUF4157
MADTLEDLSPEERTELEAAGTLSDEIARKWDPERLLKLVAKQAGRGEKLDASTRSKFEQRLGVDLGRVRVYTGEFAQTMTRAHRAQALTIGNTGMILMSGGAAAEGTEAQALLAHELTHVAQAERGVHRRADFGDSPSLSSSAGEAEAEQAADVERQSAAGGVAAAAEATQAEEDKKAQADAMEEAVIKRVMELFADDARTYTLRNGQDPYRP